MNRLILFRHGKANHDAPSGRDFDRRLAPRGVQDSAAAARHLADLGLAPELVLVSASARTRDTWTAVASALPQARVQFEDDLYHADVPTLRRMICAAGKAPGAVMVIGHNPGLQDLTVELLVEGGADAGLLARARAQFPTAAAAVFLIGGDGRPHYDGIFFPRDRRDD